MELMVPPNIENLAVTASKRFKRNLTFIIIIIMSTLGMHLTANDVIQQFRRHLPI